MARPEDRASLVGLTRWSGLRRSTTSHILPDGEVRWISQKYSQAQNACPPTKTALLVRKLAWRAFHFWEGEWYQHTRRGSLDSLGFQLDQQKRGLTRMKVSEDAPFRCGSPISLQNDSCLSAMSVIASASKHTVSCTHALNNLYVSDKCVAASGIPAIASAPFAGKRPQEKRSCLEG